MPTPSKSRPKPQGVAALRLRESPSDELDGYFDSAGTSSQSAASDASAAPVSGKQHCAVALSAVVEGSRLQPRAPFTPQTDAEDAALVESLSLRGQDVPVILEQIAGRQPAAYRIKDGHRRIAALRQIGAERVEAIVVQAGTSVSDLITLTANVRKNYSPMEWAHCVERLLQDGHSLANVARQTGLVPQRLSEWKQLLDLAPEVQAALEQGGLSLQVALAIGKAPLPFQAQLARVAEQNDLTEAKARQLAGRVRDSLMAGGPVAVEVSQLAAALGLSSSAGESASAGQGESAAAHPSESAPARCGSTGEAALAPETVPGEGAGARRRKRARGRAPEKAVTAEIALQVLRGHFPDLEARSLANQAAAQGLTEKALLLAGLYVQDGDKEAAEAIATALSCPLTPDIRAEMARLDLIAREYDRLKRGLWDEQNERLLHIQWLAARQVERVKRAAAQARKRRSRPNSSKKPRR